MKKIATITFHNALNIGAALQAYALQQAIIKLGYETEIIDYRNTSLERHYSTWHASGTSITRFVKIMLSAPIKIAKRKRFSKFTQEHLKTSNQIITDAQFQRLNNVYDSFVVGSDQVWNPYHTKGLDPRYFLDFVTDSNKLKTYAVSFGMTDIPEQLTEEYKQLTSRFKSVLVREPSAINILESLGLSGSKSVVDPVYLLNTEDWLPLIKKPLVIYRYVLVFCVNGTTKNIADFAKKIAKNNNLKIIHLTSKPVPFKGMVNKTNIGPSEVLGYIYEADYVITDSFHAMSFSIIFNKDFFMEIASQHGNKNNRSLELMKKLGISERLIGNDNQSIDWTNVNKNIVRERQHSFDLLEESIS